MLGMFINTLPVRVDARAEQFLLPWLKAIQDAQVEMRQYEYSPLIQVQGWSGVARGTPLFDSLYVFENYPAGIESGNSIAGVTIEEFRMTSPTGFPLALLVGPGSRLNLQLCYDSDLFDPPSIRRMLGHIESFLEQVAGKADRRLRDIALLKPDERHKVIVDSIIRLWTSKETAYCIHSLKLRWSARRMLSRWYSRKSS
jgi:non-ribosomal peptide synthetase component F